MNPDLQACDASLAASSMHFRFILILTGWLAGGLIPVAVTAGAEGDAPKVMVSTKPIHSLVAALMEGVAEPSLIPKKDSPYAHTLDIDQKDALASADLVVWVGPELEPALGAFFEAQGKKVRGLQLLTVDSLKVLPARNGGDKRDPFIWLDTRNMLILLDELSALLATLDPVRTHRYESNRLQVLKSLSQLDRELEYGYKQVSSIPVFSYHDTHQYFEQAYAMKVAAVATTQTVRPTTETLLEMRELLEDAPSPCVLTEAALPEPHLDLLVARTDARITEIDSFGVRLEPGAGLYEKLMRDQFQAIRDCTAGHTNATKTSDAALILGMGAGTDILPHRIQGKYLLMNHFGEPVSNLDFAGQYQLIYFGYTFCPDICPTSLSTMTQALKLLGTKADRIQPLFISVDPDRDTPEKLRNYTAYFHPRLLGLTGPMEMIARVATQFHVRYEKVMLEDRPPNQYAVDHTSSLFLLDPDGLFVAKFAHGLPASDLADRLDELISE